MVDSNPKDCDAPKQMLECIHDSRPEKVRSKLRAHVFVQALASMPFKCRRCDYQNPAPSCTLAVNQVCGWCSHQTVHPFHLELWTCWQRVATPSGTTMRGPKKILSE